MSKNRKSRWTEVSPVHHVTSCGEVRCNPRGKWNAIVRFKKKVEYVDGFVNQTVVCGEFKRAREAMMAVEQRAKELYRQGTLISVHKELT